MLQLVAPKVWDAAGWKRKGEWVGQGEGAGFFRFALRYCNAHKEMVGRNKTVWKFDGSSNLPELQDKLRATCMIRRLKSEVLTDLPAKVRQIVTLESDDHDEDDYGDIGDDFETATARLKSVPFKDIAKVRHAQALAKVKASIEHIASVLDAGTEEGKKVIVFAHHKDVIDKLVKGLSKYGVVSLVGEDAIAARAEAVEVFQTKTEVRVFVGSLKAAGVGLTLTAASHVIFVERDWTPATVTQGEDRAHRIGQRDVVLVQHLVSEGSIDAKMTRFLTEKQNIADLALDTETIQDVSGREVVSAKNAADPTVNPAPLPSVSADEIAAIHADLRTLAERCDGAVAQDGMGYNGLDSNFGKTLAALPKLSVRQAAAAKKMLVKYRKQLGK